MLIEDGGFSFYTLMCILHLFVKHISIINLSFFTHQTFWFTNWLLQVYLQHWSTVCCYMHTYAKISLIRKYCNFSYYCSLSVRIDVFHPGRAWSSSPACTWHCSLHYLLLQATP